jgi:uncharacterized membrane protein
MAKDKKPRTKDPAENSSASLPSPNSPSSQITRSQVAVRSAPLPHPAELEAYEAVLPGAAERIFIMAESQSKHRQNLELQALSLEGRNSLLGILAAWFIGVFGLSVAGFCIYTGHDLAGGVIGGASLASLVSTFIYGTRQRRLEREQKYLIGQTQGRNQR